MNGNGNARSGTFADAERRTQSELESGDKSVATNWADTGAYLQLYHSFRNVLFNQNAGKNNTQKQPATTVVNGSGGDDDEGDKDGRNQKQAARDTSANVINDGRRRRRR